MQVGPAIEGGARCVAEVFCGACDDWGVSPPTYGPPQARAC